MLRTGNGGPKTKRDQIADMVGDDATTLAYRAVIWLRLAALMAFPTIPILALLSRMLHNPRILLGVVIALVVGIPLLIRGGTVNRQASKAASMFLTRQYGRPIKIKSGGTRIWGWQKELERAVRPDNER